MRNRYFKYALVLLAFMFAISVIHWIGIDGLHRPGLLEAKITDETPVFNEETVIFDEDNPQIKNVMAVQNRHTPKLMAKPEVVGTATGLTEDGRPAILVFTKKKVEVGAIPEDVEGVPVVVKVTGEILAMSCTLTSTDPTAKFNLPVPIGVSTGNIGECSAGTIGARVKDSANNLYALSNNHVYALENNALLNSQVLQPGLYDTVCSSVCNNIIGSLSSYVPIIFNTVCKPPKKTAGCNKVDAAIASSSTGQLSNSTLSLPNGYGIPNKIIRTLTIADVYNKLAVKKYGRTTKLTTGIINGINATVKVGYGASGNAIFVNQITVSSLTPFILSGDSGSLLVTNDINANPVGLLFAGNSSGTFAVANPIKEVLDSFVVTIDGK